MTDEAPEAPALDPLLVLQELDLSIDRLEHRREELEGGSDVASARQRANDLEDEVGDLKLGLDSVGREQTRHEVEIESYSRRIDTEEKRLNDGSVANAKELQSIQAEIHNLKTRRSKAEDELLGQMVQREEMEGRLSPLQAELTEALDRLTEIRGSSAIELEDIEKALEERKQERIEAAAAIDEELLELYEDLRRMKKGIGAAAVVNHVCMACHQELSPMEYENIKAQDGIRRCPNCRRILIFA
jgi:predicted  nucleic acid-binding Zn-ribbon protein